MANFVIYFLKSELCLFIWNFTPYVLSRDSFLIFFFDIGVLLVVFFVAIFVENKLFTVVSLHVAPTFGTPCLCTRIPFNVCSLVPTLRAHTLVGTHCPISLSSFLHLFQNRLIPLNSIHWLLSRSQGGYLYHFLINGSQ